ncbi:MAG: hypothetical protein IKV30_07660 [Clostridia bacterium]|nr:hypothetical protein [Clostridia bacterium]
MKKVVITLIVVVMVIGLCLLTACSEGDQTYGNTGDIKTSDLGTLDQSEKDNSSTNNDQNVQADKDWYKTEGNYEGDVVPTKEVAISIAQAIFDGLENVGNIADYVIQDVFYDEEDHVWVVSFWPEMEDPDEAWVGGDCNIALQQTDGKVLRIWFGE